MADDIAAQIADALNEYGDMANDVLADVIDEVAKDTVKTLRRTSPKRTGKYARSWKQKEIKDSPLRIERVVFASGKKYAITHLLEKGHAKKNGGRVAAIPHIADAEQAATEMIIEKLRDRL